MAPHLLRALSSTLLVGAALHCAATDAGEPTVDPQNIFTIPEKGLEADEQKEVWLGPSKAVRVVDNTRAAVLFPQQGDNPLPAPSPEQMSAVAYVFENGVCDFEKTVEYKKLFPGHEKPLWVRTAPAAAAGAEEASPAPAANYTFTNPSAEVLGGEGASFCVRFRVQRPLQPQPPTQAPGDTSLGGDNGKGGKDRSGPKDLVESSPQEQPQQARGGAAMHGPSAGSASAGAIPDNSPSVDDKPSSGAPNVNGESEKEEKLVEVPGVPISEPSKSGGATPVAPKPPLQPPPHREVDDAAASEVLGGDLTHSDPPDAQPANDNVHVQGAVGSEGNIQSGHQSAKPELQEEAEQLNREKAEERHARLRRLSEPTELQDKYLTIIVHSAAWRAAASAASTALLAAAASLLPVF